MPGITSQETHVNTLLTSGGDKRKFGVGFPISKETNEKITNFFPVTAKLCYVEVKGNINMTILNMYAPTGEKADDEKDDFFE